MSTHEKDNDPVLPDGAPSSSKKRKEDDSTIVISDSENSAKRNKRAQKKSNEAPMTFEECCNVLSKLENWSDTNEALYRIYKICQEQNGKELLSCIVSMHGGIPNTIKAMKKFPDHALIQVNGLSVCCGVLVVLGQSFASAIVGARVFTLATKAMEKFPSDGNTHVTSLLLFQLVMVPASDDERTKFLSDVGKDFIPFLGHALVTTHWAPEAKSDPAEQSLTCLWRISETAEGRKMIIDAGVHHQLEDFIFKTQNDRLRKKGVTLRLRVVQDHYGDVPGHWKKIGHNKI